MTKDIIRIYPTVRLSVPSNMQILGRGFAYYMARRQRTTQVGRFGFRHERAVVLAPTEVQVRALAEQFSIELRKAVPYEAQTPSGNGTTLYFCVLAATPRSSVEAMAEEIFRHATVQEWREMR